MDDFIGSAGYNKPTKEQLNAKKWMKIIGIILAILLIVVIGLMALMYYIQKTELKINLDGKSNNKLENILIFEDDKLYIPIRKFASFMGYNSGNDEYKKYEEDATKCYIESNDEVASFSLGSNKIYKIVLDDENDYEYYEIEEPVRMINNDLCTTIEGARIAFNTQIIYNKNKNQIDIYTLPYLVKYYTSKFSNSGIADKEADFSNQKALLYDMIVIKNDKDNNNNNYGVYSLTGQEILGVKYASVKFIESTKEFIVTTPENKMGIMGIEEDELGVLKASTKITPEYDNIKQIDKDSGLYLVSNNKKQGVINKKGSIVIYLEYDQIGVDITKFEANFKNNNIKNQYLLYGNCIPVKVNNLWGIFDKTGRKITEIKYDDLGCSEGSGKAENKNYNNVLLIPTYKGIVVKENDRYGVINSEGKELLPSVIQSIYSIIASGEENYYMTYNDQDGNLLSSIETRMNKKNKDKTNEENNTSQAVNNEVVEANQENVTTNEISEKGTINNEITNNVTSPMINIEKDE